jgi:hypothetical protein
MGEDDEQTQRLAEPPPGVAAGNARGVGTADPCASTLTVAAPGAPAGPRLDPGRELGPVRLLREIGRGATGTVFQGYHTVLGRDVAVKFLLHASAAPGDDGLRRFVDEARAAAAVRHAHLTQIFHADVDCGTPYLVLEYVRGPTLRQLLDAAGPLGVPAAAAILTDVAAAVQELHARGVIHRDIKPSNVLVDKDAHVFVTDFGLAVRRSHGQAADFDFAGTPAYMAPEMYEGRISPRTDVYAMGVMAFQLLTGTTPFAGTFDELREKHVREPLPSDALRERGVRPEVVEVVERATNKQAMFRYKAAPDFARALRDAAGCGLPDLARARKQLCDLVAGRAAGSAGGDPTVPGPGAATAEHRLAYRAGEAVDDGSSLYTETISRIATIKRERRMHPGAEGDGSSTALPVTPPIAAAPAAAPRFAPVPFVAESARPHRAGVPAGEAPAVPAAVLALSVVATVYGAMVVVWLAGQLVGASGLRPYLPPASADHIRVYAWVVAAALASFALAAAAIVAGAACFRPRAWARRLMIRYAVADLAFQLLVLLVAVAWVGPVTVSAITAGGTHASPGDRSALAASVYLSWATRWLMLSLFPAAALFVMTRRRVREAFAPAAPVEG